VWGKLGTHGWHACKVARRHGPALSTTPNIDVALQADEDIVRLAVEMEPNGRRGGATGSHDREGVVRLLTRNEQARRRVGAGDEDVLAAEEGQHKRAVWLSGRDVQLYHCAGVVAVDGHGYGGERRVWWTSREMEAPVARVRPLATIISEWLSTGVGRAASDHIATRQGRAKASLYSESPRGGE
jgi:hypothetical protein